LIGGKIPLFRQVTNFSRKLLKTRTLTCCFRDYSIAKSVIFVVFAPLALRAGVALSARMALRVEPTHHDAIEPQSLYGRNGRPSYRFDRAGFRGRRRAGVTLRRVPALPRRREVGRAARVANRQSTAMPIGIAAMPSAIAVLAMRWIGRISAATATNASTRPAPKVNRAALV
jgi:hypothetical protein